MSPTIQFIFFHYLFIVIVCFICFIIGGRLTVNVKYHNFWERLSISTTLGLGILALLIFFLGLFKGLYGRILIPIVLTALIAAIATWPGLLKIKTDLKGWRAIIWNTKGYTIVWISIIAATVWVTYTLPLYPPIYWDSIEYHLAVAKIYTQSHALVFTPYLRFPVAPQLNHMLFVGAFIASDEISAHLIEYAMFFLIACGLYAFSRRFFSPWVGILSAALWLGSPLSVLYGSVGYIDIGLTLFAFLGVYSFINYYHSNGNNWLWLSGIFLGFATAVKYPSLFIVLVCGLISLWLAIKKRDYLIPVKLGLAVLVVAAPFYIRSYYYSGNPFFPFLSNIFHQRLWNTADALGLANEQNLYGLPKTAVSLVELPWYLIYEPNLFSTAMGDTLLFSPVYFLSFGSLLLMFFFRRTWMLNLFITSFTLFWFSTAQIIRYLLPVIPLLALAGSIVVYYLIRFVGDFLSRWDSTRIFTRVIQPVLISTLAFAILIPSVKFGSLRHNFLGEIPVTSAERDQFLQRFLPSYPAYRSLNKKLGDNYSLYALFDTNMAYFTNGTFMGDWFGPARYSMLTDKLDNDVLLYQELRQLGADYFLINLNFQGQIPEALLHSPFFQVIDQADTYVVYKLAASP